MTEDTKNLEARIRQLMAVDTNALAIYTKLAEQAPDPSLSQKLKKIAEDEARHVELEKQMLARLGP